MPSQNKIFEFQHGGSFIALEQDMNSAHSSEHLVDSKLASGRIDEESEYSTTINVGAGIVSAENASSPSVRVVDSATLRGETKSKVPEGPKIRRLVNKTGELKVLAKNVPRKTRLYLADLFTTLIDLRWKWVIFIFVASYIISWTLFGLIWWLIAYLRGYSVCVWKV